MESALSDLIDRVRAAAAHGQRLQIRGGGSKAFVAQPAPQGELLGTTAWTGVTSYEPSELVVTARAGTPLAELEALLAEQRQCLPFEPPHFGPGATVGGMVAAGLSGPARASTGAVRDFVLGAKMVNGRGELLRFGGQVMKNVAGYDVSRLIAGSMGTLGVIVEATLKVLPMPVAEQTLRFAMDEGEALTKLNQWGGQPLPISASFWHDGQLWLRLSGARAAVEAAAHRLGPNATVDAQKTWISIREQTHPAFAGEPLWRLSLPSTVPALGVDGLRAIEWGGAQRWYADEPAAIREVAARLGGHAVLYRAPESQRCLDGAFAPLSPALLALPRRLKKAFDPRGILNPGRLYAEF